MQFCIIKFSTTSQIFALSKLSLLSTAIPIVIRLKVFLEISEIGNVCTFHRKCRQSLFSSSEGILFSRLSSCFVDSQLPNLNSGLNTVSRNCARKIFQSPHSRARLYVCVCVCVSLLSELQQCAFSKRERERERERESMHICIGKEAADACSFE